MAWSLDARIPLRLGTLADAGVDDAVLVEGAGKPARAFESFDAAHAIGCACCGARSPVAIALDRLFQRRVRGQIDFFKSVVAVTTTADGDLAVWAAVRNDPVASARYRLVDGPSGTS